VGPSGRFAEFAAVRAPDQPVVLAGAVTERIGCEPNRI